MSVTEIGTNDADTVGVVVAEGLPDKDDVRALDGEGDKLLVIDEVLVAVSVAVGLNNNTETTEEGVPEGAPVGDAVVDAVPEIVAVALAVIELVCVCVLVIDGVAAPDGVAAADGVGVASGEITAHTHTSATSSKTMLCATLILQPCEAGYTQPAIVNERTAGPGKVKA